MINTGPSAGQSIFAKMRNPNPGAGRSAIGAALGGLGSALGGVPMQRPMNMGGMAMGPKPPMVPHGPMDPMGGPLQAPPMMPPAIDTGPSLPPPTENLDPSMMQPSGMPQRPGGRFGNSGNTGINGGKMGRFGSALGAMGGMFGRYR